jgi:hypothetical protein
VIGLVRDRNRGTGLRTAIEQDTLEEFVHGHSVPSEQVLEFSRSLLTLRVEMIGMHDTHVLRVLDDLPLGRWRTHPKGELHRILRFLGGECVMSVPDRPDRPSV